MLYQRLPAAVVQLPTWFKGSQAAISAPTWTPSAPPGRS